MPHIKPSKLHWPTKKEHSADMREKQALNKLRAPLIPAENWMAAKLATTGYKWTRQAAWGYRIFDFWNAKLGIAVEVDGSSHTNPKRDAFFDREHFHRSGIIVLRVRNFNEAEARAVLAAISEATESWEDRRKRLGVHRTTKGKRGQESFSFA